MLTDEQLGVLKGMVAGLAITVASLGIAIIGLLEPLVPAADASLTYALKWDALIVVCLTINIAVLARHRFVTPEDIDGGGLCKGTQTAQLLQSMLQNTLEQTVLAVGVHAIWASVMPQTWQPAVPIASIMFVAGRIMFWRGYSKGASARALGFALTFYPSVLMLVVIVGHLVFGQ